MKIDAPHIDGPLNAHTEWSYRMLIQNANTLNEFFICSNSAGNGKSQPGKVKKKAKKES